MTRSSLGNGLLVRHIVVDVPKSNEHSCRLGWNDGFISVETERVD